MDSNTVRRVVVNSADDIVIEHVARPVAAAGEAVVRSTIVGICGSDMHAAHGRHPFMSLPFRPGHEVVGVVSAVGEGADSRLIAQRVVIEPNLPCGSCGQCRAGRYNICWNLEVFGCQTPGGMADEFAIAADRLIPLPDDLEDEWAALIEPFSTPMHAVRRAGDLKGKRVMVIGAGPIGLFTMVAALHAGAERVVIGELLPSKRDRAIRLGAHGSFDPAADDAASEAHSLLGGPAHVVFDCVSRESTAHLAVETLDKGGTLMIIGVPGGRTMVDLDLIQDRELVLQGNLMFVRQDVLAAIELLRTKPFPHSELVTSTFALQDAPQAFKASDDPEQVKVLVTVDA